MCGCEVLRRSASVGNDGTLSLEDAEYKEPGEKFEDAGSLRRIGEGERVTCWDISAKDLCDGEIALAMFKKRGIGWGVPCGAWILAAIRPSHSPPEKCTPAFDLSATKVKYVMAGGSARREAAMGCGQMLFVVFILSKKSIRIRRSSLCGGPLAKMHSLSPTIC